MYGSFLYLLCLLDTLEELLVCESISIPVEVYASSRPDHGINCSRIQLLLLILPYFTIQAIIEEQTEHDPNLANYLPKVFQQVRIALSVMRCRLKGDSGPTKMQRLRSLLMTMPRRFLTGACLKIFG